MLASLGWTISGSTWGIAMVVPTARRFYQLNPNRTVPVLQDGDNPPLWETGAILRYLASRYANEAFWPGDLLARTEG